MTKIDPMPPTESKIIAENLETGFVDEKEQLFVKNGKLGNALAQMFGRQPSFSVWN